MNRVADDGQDELDDVAEALSRDDVAQRGERARDRISHDRVLAPRGDRERRQERREAAVERITELLRAGGEHRQAVEEVLPAPFVLREHLVGEVDVA